MADTPKLEVGEQVRIFDVNGKRLGQPVEGWPGEIVKVGRKLAHIHYNGGVRTFDIETRQRNDDFHHQRFETSEDRQRSASVDFLCLQGITVAYGRRSNFTNAQIEALAALVRSFTEEDNTHG